MTDSEKGPDQEPSEGTDTDLPQPGLKEDPGAGGPGESSIDEPTKPVLDPDEPSEDEGHFDGHTEP